MLCLHYLVLFVPLRVGQIWLVLRRTPASTISRIAAKNLKGMSFLTSIQLQIQVNLMNKQMKQLKSEPNSLDDCQSTEDLDIRLKRQILISSEVLRQLAFCQSQLQYAQAFLKALKEEHEAIKKHELLGKSSPFGGWQSKLKQLSVSVIDNKTEKNKRKVGQFSGKEEITVKCSQKKHLQQILSEKKRKDELIQTQLLEEKLASLYCNIESLVMEEYMNDKIVAKIKRQARKASKMKTSYYLEQEISKYKNWVEGSKVKIKGEIVGKEVEEKIIHNLQLMKLLMNKKVINNDYIYEQFVEKGSENEKMIDKLCSLSAQAQQKYESGLSFYRQKFVEQNSKSQVLRQPKQSKITTSELNLNNVAQYLHEVHQTISQLDQYDGQFEIQRQYVSLSNKLDQLLLGAKK